MSVAGKLNKDIGSNNISRIKGGERKRGISDAVEKSWKGSVCDKEEKDEMVMGRERGMKERIQERRKGTGRTGSEINSGVKKDGKRDNG